MNAEFSDHSLILRQSRDYETLVASALYLMTRYLQTGNQTLSDAVAAHLAALSEHPGCPNVCLARTVRKLSEEWRTIATTNPAGDPGGLH